MSGKPFTVDRLPFDLDDEPSFGIYLQGHDKTAGHRIVFTKRDTDWTVDWSGNIALTYLGGREFKHRFTARKVGVAFEGITLPADIKEDQAATTLARFMRDAGSYSLEKTQDGELRFVNKTTKNSSR